jgi:hypothetical protein
MTKAFRNDLKTENIVNLIDSVFREKAPKYLTDKIKEEALVKTSVFLKSRNKKFSLLLPESLYQLQNFIAEFSGVEILFRKAKSVMGFFSTPSPEFIQLLLSQASSQWKNSKTPLERLYFEGLALLLIHPFNDLNGTTARLIWALRLLQQQTPVSRIEKGLNSLMGEMKVSFIAAVSQARQGDSQAFNLLFQRAFDLKALQTT